MTEYPWEPPLAGTEVEQLTGSLDRLRTTFRWKADDLDAAGLQTRIGASSLTLGGLLKHLSRAEDDMFSTKLSGAPVPDFEGPAISCTSLLRVASLNCSRSLMAMTKEPGPPITQSS